MNHSGVPKSVKGACSVPEAISSFSTFFRVGKAETCRSATCSSSTSTWIKTDRPFATVEEELKTLARQAANFRRLLEPKKGDVLFALATFLGRFDVSTAYPLLLHFFDVGLTDEAWKRVSTGLESYLLRRAVCGLTTKNYNRVFLELTRFLRAEGATPEKVEQFLGELTGETREWPSDDAFRTSWIEQHAYTMLQNAKLVHILRSLSDTYLTAGSEHISIDTPLTVEHLMPQEWIEHWPLADGSAGMTEIELWDAPEADPRAAATRARKAAVQTMGNLTIVTQPLNSSVSNSAWSVKRPELLSVSLLSINQQLHSYDFWNESTIAERSKALFQKALRLWPRPAVAAPAQTKSERVQVTMANTVAILIIGSLIWNKSEHRESWRNTRLSLGEKKRVRSPIRYGRLSGTTSSKAYTMVFSNELVPTQLGWALAVPCRYRVNTQHQLFEEAEALWAAEHSKATAPGPLAERWGAVGLLCNPNSPGLEELKATWSQRIAGDHEIYRDFPHADGEVAAVSPDGVLTIPWPTMESGHALDVDLVLATATVPEPIPGGHYATPENIASAWTKYPERRHYFDENRLCGISTAFDDAILKALNAIS